MGSRLLREKELGQRREEIRADERGGPWIYIPVSHFEPSAARLKFSRGRADVIKTNYAYGTVMPHYFIPYFFGPILETATRSPGKTYCPSFGRLLVLAHIQASFQRAQRQHTPACWPRRLRSILSVPLAFAVSLGSLPLRLVLEGNKDGSAYVQPATGGGARLPSVGRTNANDSSMQDGVGIRRTMPALSCPQAAFIFSMRCAACAANAPPYALPPLNFTPAASAPLCCTPFGRTPRALCLRAAGSITLCQAASC